jgi:hypothetical protein
MGNFGLVCGYANLRIRMPKPVASFRGGAVEYGRPGARVPGRCNLKQGTLSPALDWQPGSFHSLRSRIPGPTPHQHAAAGGFRHKAIVNVRCDAEVTASLRGGSVEFGMAGGKGLCLDHKPGPEPR